MKSNKFKCPHCHKSIDLKLKCLRCGHEWERRLLGRLPKLCPGHNCKSKYWNTPRRKKTKQKKV